MFVVHYALCLGVHNLSVGIIDSHLVAFFLFTLHVQHLAGSQLLDIFVLLNFQQFLDLALHLVGV